MASILPWATAYFRRTREQKEVFTHIWGIVHLLQCSLEHIIYYLISNANRYAIDTRKKKVISFLHASVESGTNMFNH